MKHVGATLPHLLPYSAPKLLELVKELQDIDNWKAFGLHLGIKIGKLNTIEKEHSTIEDRRIKMLEEWQNNVIPTWSAVVQALLEIGRRCLGSELAQKYGEFSHLDLHN